VWYDSSQRGANRGTPMDSVNNQLDGLRKIHSNQSEFWMARDLMPVLGYSKWDNFQAVISKAKMACESAGIDPNNHFLDIKKPVPSGSGTMTEKADCFLSRYACYLVAMNGDTSKPQIGMAQTYFAVQARRQEVFDELTEAEKRIEVRDRVKQHNKQLNAAAKRAGVVSKMFGIFHDEGYRGLYGMSLAEIKSKKNIPESETVLDYAGRVELAANDFRITQTEQKLTVENIQGQQAAINVHHAVGRQVRETIRKIGGPMPENLPPELHIKKLKASRKKQKKLTE
jgi:DNA-damage-inducible protein D